MLLVSRQSFAGGLVIYPVASCHHFPLSRQLPSQSQNVAVFLSLYQIILFHDRSTLCVNKWPRVITGKCKSPMMLFNVFV